MKAGLAIVLFLLTGFGAFSQKDYFIYIQTDNSQPFYVLMDGKTFSSSDHGYIILSGLQGQAYQLVIGFPRNAFPEQNFILNVFNRDAGYQLKNFADKGWGLTNYQSAETIMNRNSDKGNSMISGTRKTDGFSVLLSNVVNDTSILYESVAPQTVVAQTATAATQQPDSTQATTAQAATNPSPVTQPSGNAATIPSSTENATIAPIAGAATVVASNNAKDTVKLIVDTVAKAVVVAAEPVIVKTDSLAGAKKIAADSVIAKAPAKTDSIVAVIPSKPALSSVKKITESSTNDALEEVFIDISSSGVDTIRIATPLTKEPVAQTPVSAPAVVVAPSEAVKTDTTVKKEIADTATTTTKPVVNHPQINNSDCKNTATGADIDKLRVKLLSINDLGEKIATTKKLLKSKCFTVKQLRAISELFTEDESKYQLFETAYPFTLDTYNYSTLEDLIKSDYYRDRFKAMIKR